MKAWHSGHKNFGSKPLSHLRWQAVSSAFAAGAARMPGKSISQQACDGNFGWARTGCLPIAFNACVWCHGGCRQALRTGHASAGRARHARRAWHAGHHRHCSRHTRRMKLPQAHESTARTARAPITQAQAGCADPHGRRPSWERCFGAALSRALRVALSKSKRHFRARRAALVHGLAAWERVQRPWDPSQGSRLSAPAPCKRRMSSSAQSLRRLKIKANSSNGAVLHWVLGILL